MRAAGGVTQLRKPVLLYTESEEKAIPKFAFPPQHRECGKRLRRRGGYGKMKNMIDETHQADKLEFN